MGAARAYGRIGVTARSLCKHRPPFDGGNNRTDRSELVYLTSSSFEDITPLRRYTLAAPIQAPSLTRGGNTRIVTFLPPCESFLSSVYWPSCRFAQGSPGLTENC
jgi:hypothetical protein